MDSDEELKSWTYEPAADLDQTAVERLRGFPREPDMLVYGLRSVFAVALRAWLRIYHRFEISGLDNLPAEGSFVIVANHSSHLDTLCLLAALPLKKLHRVFPAAAADYFFVDVPRAAFSAIVVNALPFSRSIHAKQNINLCRQLLGNPGNILVIFPEGTRSITGALGEFKPGIGMLVAGTAIPVVPAWLDGAASCLPKGSILPRSRKVRLTFGAPRRFDALQMNPTSARIVAEELRRAVGALSAKSS